MTRRDALTGGALAGGAGLAVLGLSSLIDPAASYGGAGWFQADVPYRLAMLTDHTSEFVRNYKHPTFAAIGGTPVAALRMVFDLAPITAVRVVAAAAAAVWAAGVFWILRQMGCRRVDATLMTLLGISSAAFIFWTSVPESFLFGSLGFVLTMALVIRTDVRRPSWTWFALAGALNLGITLTNVMISIVATLTVFSWRQTAVILGVSTALTAILAALIIGGTHPLVYLAGGVVTAVALFRWRRPTDAVAAWVDTSPVARQVVLASVVAVPLLAIVATLTVPAVRADLQRKWTQQSTYVSSATLGRVVEVITSLGVTTMVMPLPTPETQTAAPGSGSAVGPLAVALWLALFALGVHAMLTTPTLRRFRVTLALGLASQAALHLVYGEETFLYSMHLLPFLVLIAAWGMVGRHRTLAVVLTTLLVLTAAVNNVHQFRLAATRLNAGP